MEQPDIDKLITTHLDYAKAVAAKVRRRCNLPRQFDQEDLEGYALMGLTQAAQTFDPDRGIRFTTASYNRIVGAILNGLAQQRGLSAQHADDLRRMERAESLVPDPEDVPEAAPNDIEAANHAAQTIKDVTKSITLSLVFSDCARGEAVDEETPDEEAARRETTEQLTTALEDLDIASRQLVQYLYFDRLTTEQAGAKLGIDKSNVTRRHKKVLAQLSERLAPSG